MLPEYSQARKSMWDAVTDREIDGQLVAKRRIDWAFPPEIRKTTRDQEMMISFSNGSTFQLVGSDNFNSLVGSPPVGLVFSEYALSNPSSWGFLRPILLQNNGWAAFNSTPRGKNHFHKICNLAEREPDWFYSYNTADTTDVFTKEQLASELRELQDEHGEDYGRAMWLQEYFCSFDAAIPGSIWGDCLIKAAQQGRIGAVPFDGNFPVSTAWDLGRTDDTAIWFFQLIHGEIRIIDYHASSLKDIEFYAQLLRDKIKDRGFSYATHWVPHDARPIRLGMGGKSILQQFHDHNVGRFAFVPHLDKQEGIQAARATFPHCRFDEERCGNGIELLKQYHREYDTEKQCFRDTPEHDKSSHCADAFRYLSLVWKHPKTKEPSISPEMMRKRMLSGNLLSQPFGVYKKMHLNRKASERSMKIS